MRIFLIIAMLIANPIANADSPWDQVSDSERATLEAVKATSEALENWMDLHDQGFCPEGGSSLFEIASILEQLPTDRRISSKQTVDGFGGPIVAWCNGIDWALLSYGADGEANSDYADSLPSSSPAGDDILMVRGELRSNLGHLNDALEFARQRQTLTDMRSLATVFKVYEIDHNQLPGDPVQEMTPIFNIETLVAPIYIRRLPLRDGWGNRFVFWHDGTQFRIASPGADGELEADYASSAGMGAYDRTDYGRDIVFSDDQFEQWPDGVTP